MTIDRRKSYYLTIDTETANTLENPIVFDIGGAIHDKKGEVLETFSFIIREVFYEMPHLMSECFYLSKIPYYNAQIFNGERQVVSFYHAKKHIEELCEKYNVKKYLRSQNGFYDMPKHILNFHIEEKENDIIRRVFSLPHITLKDNAKWALGIITGNNAKHCHKERLQGDVPIYRGKDIFSDRIASPSLFVNKNLERCRQVADMDFYEAKDKIIYRFISDKIICHHDMEQRYILNSANLFILDENFPLTYEQVCDILNSDFMNWLFKSIFNTHKILRSDLELLPLCYDYFNDKEKFLNDLGIKV